MSDNDDIIPSDEKECHKRSLWDKVWVSKGGLTSHIAAKHECQELMAEKIFHLFHLKKFLEKSAIKMTSSWLISSRTKTIISGF